MVVGQADLEELEWRVAASNIMSRTLNKERVSLIKTRNLITFSFLVHQLFPQRVFG